MSGIDPIADVDIRVEIGGERGLGRESGGEDEALQAAVEENRLDRETENRVVSLVSNKFGIASGLIEVSQISDSRPAASTGKARR